MFAADESKFKLPTMFKVAFAAMALVALATFAVSANGLYGYGVHALHLGSLALVLPAAVDLLSLCGIYTTYLTRNDAWHVRAYAWTVFAVPTMVSIAGNAVDAQLRGDVQAGVIGAGFPPVLLALAVHSVIVVRRSLERADAAQRAQEMLEAASRRAGGVSVVSGSTSGDLACVYRCWASDGSCIWIGHTADLADRLNYHRTRAAWWAEVVRISYDTYSTIDRAREVERNAIKSERPIYNRQHNPDAKITRRGTVPRPVDEPQKPTRQQRGLIPEGERQPAPISNRERRRPGAPPNSNRDLARKRVAAGESPREVAADLGVSRRSVELWTKDIRATSRDRLSSSLSSSPLHPPTTGGNTLPPPTLGDDDDNDDNNDRRVQ